MPLGRKHLYARLLIVAFFAFSAAWWSTSPKVVEKANIDWVACLLLLAGCPIALLIVLGMQTLNRTNKWKLPSWKGNLFKPSEPLQFFHLSAFCFLAGGFGGLVLLPFRGLRAAPVVTSLIAIGIGLLVGVKLGIKLYRTRIE